MTEQPDYVELVRISDPVQADLLAAFLEDGDVEFQVVNRSGAGFMSQLIPRAANPVLFRILAGDLDRGQVLLTEYRTLQQKPSSPDDDIDDDMDDDCGEDEDHSDVSLADESGTGNVSVDSDILEGEDDEISDWETEVDASATERD